MLWAALCAAEICDRPTVNTKVAPINRQMMPALMRCETETEPFNTVVVMFTLRETVFGRLRPFCSAGLLTCGVLAFGAFPVSQWQIA